MLVKLDDEVLFEIDERMMKLLAHDLLDPVEEIKRRLRWVIEHKCDRCFERMSEEWTRPDEKGETKLSKSGRTAIPTNRRGLADVILSHPGYKNRVAREEDARLAFIESSKKKELNG